MRMKVLVLMLLAVVLLTACGGGSQTVSRPTPTPTATLTVEERIEFAPGTQQNPFRMVFKKTDTIQERVRLIVSTMLDTRLNRVQLDSSLRDDLNAGDDLVAVFAGPLLRDFDISFDAQDAESIATVADMVAFVEAEVATQAAAALFEYTRLNFELVPVTGYAEALSELCNSGNGIVSMSWLNGPTYFAAQAQNCGRPSLQDVQIAMASETGPDFLDVEFVLPEATPEATAEMTAEAEAVEASEEAETTAEATAEATEAAETTAEATAEATEATEESAELSADAQAAEATPTREGEAVDAQAATEEATPEATEEMTEAPAETPGAETALSTEPRIRGELLTGEPAVLLVDASIGAASLQVVPTRTFCRISVDDFYSWFVPNLLFARDNVMPASIAEYDDYEELIEAVSEGECAATVVPLSAFNAQGDVEGVNVGETTPAFPFGVLLYPSDVALGERFNLADSLPALTANDADARPLRLLMGQDAIVPATPELFADLAALMSSTGLDLAQLGR